MVQIKWFGRMLAVFAASLAAIVAMGQSPVSQSSIEQAAQDGRSRISGDWRSSALAPIENSRPPRPTAAVDLGPAPSGARLERMLLLLEPSAAQRAALDAELAAQPNSGSPEYRHWLIPSKFADSYANSASDVETVAAWLQAEGFTVAGLPAGRGWIEFSGTVSQVEHAFETSVHSYGIEGATRLALADGISVPAPLGPLVHGLVSLDGVVAEPAITTPHILQGSAADLLAVGGSARAEAITPNSMAGLLHIDAVHSAGNIGAGQTIAVAARSNINVQDFAEFRKAFGLEASAVEVRVDGADPRQNGDEAEAMLEASWTSAAAPGASIVLVPAATTPATDGIDLSLAAIVDGNLAHTAAVGFTACEAAMSEAHRAFYAALFRQGAAQGMAVIVAAGDRGAAACHGFGEGAVTSGFGVNALASTPWNTGVGSVGTKATAGSDSPVDLEAWATGNAAEGAYAGGGGRSSVYAAPTWQPLPTKDSVAGVASGKYARLLPDLALPVAAEGGANRGVAFCLSSARLELNGSKGCYLVRAGGTSAATAIFAGIAALVAEKNGAQGNLAPHLYGLSRQAGYFDDVKQGNTRLPCAAGSRDCDASGTIGFDAVSGYDLATGLGSVNAEKLVKDWATPAATGTGATTVSLDITPAAANSTYNPTAQITFTATVVSQTGGTMPTGTVVFFDKATNANISATPSAVGANAVATLTITSGLVQGGNNVQAVYSGDSNYATASSQPVTVTTEPSTTGLVVTPSSATPAAGSTITVTTTLTVGMPAAGTVAPSGKVTLNLDGLPTATATPSTTATGTTASFTVTIPSAGVHTLQTVYAGDANYTASTSPAVTVTASKGATVTALTATPATLTAGTPETLTATLAPVSAASGTAYAITGTVNFYDGTTLLGSAVVTANAASLANITLSPSVLHTITAVYSGDTSWAASTSNAIALQSVLLPDVVTLAVNVNTTAPGQVLTLTATVAPQGIPAANVEQNPSGKVIFYDGTTVLGSVALSAALNNSSAATLLTGSLPGGQNVLTAVYLGDLYYAPGTSNPVTIDVQDFSIAPSPNNSQTNLNIIKGTAGSASFIVTGLGGFGDKIQVVCAVPTQDDMTCTASPQQVTPTGTVTFTVQTFAAGGTTAVNGQHAPLWRGALGGAALAGLLLMVLPVGKRARRFLAGLVLLVGLTGMSIGCGSNVSLAQNSGTPLGVATLKVTASANVDNTVVSHSVYLTVNVLPPS